MLINQHRYRTVQTAGQSRLSNNKAVKNTQSLSYTGRFQSCFPPSSPSLPATQPVQLSAITLRRAVPAHYARMALTGVLQHACPL